MKRNLEEIAVSAMAFFRGMVPVLAGILGQHDLLLAQRRFFVETDTGPIRMLESLTQYLEGERRLGRISRRASAPHAARLLMGGCFAHAFLLELMGDHAAVGTEERYAREVVRTVIEGIGPGGS